MFSKLFRILPNAILSLPFVWFPAIANAQSGDQILINTDKTAINTVLAVIACALFLAPIYIYFNKQHSHARRKKLALAKFSPRIQNVILMIATAAKVDNEVNPKEVVKIQQIIRSLTDVRISQSDVNKIIKIASDDFSARDFNGPRTDLSTSEKKELLIALFGVISADGKLRKKERDFSKRLCQKLRISQHFFESTWLEFFEDNPTKLIVE